MSKILQTGNIFKIAEIQATYEKLTVWTDEDGKYLRHIPTKMSLETVKEIIGSSYFKKSNDNCKHLDEVCDIDERKDCGECCAG